MNWPNLTDAEENGFIVVSGQVRDLDEIDRETMGQKEKENL